MRKEFVEELVALAERDESIVLLTGDLGFTVLEPFTERFQDRFFNVGVAEQNMVGLATGLADAGLRPYVYSIGTFATLRPYEFVRNGPLLHELPVRIVGVGAGFDYGHNGITHYALEDVAVMRAQPRMTVVAPADSAQARAAIRQTVDLPNPVYYRLSKTSGDIPELLGRFSLGRLEMARRGDDLALVSLGTMAGEALEAAQALGERGISASVAVVSSFNPAPVDDLVELLEQVAVAVSIEEHYISGGLGSLLAETIAEARLDCRLVRCGVREMPTGQTGSQAWLRDVHGISARRLADAALEVLETARS
jgi:transketolase